MRSGALLGGVTAMLHRSRRHVSSDFSETRAFLADKGLQSRIAGRTAEPGFNARINAAYAGGFYLAYMEYGAEIEIDAPAERADYGLSIPIGGAMASVAAGDVIACTTARTVLASPGAPQRIMLAEGARRLALSFGRDAVRARLAALTGEPVRGEVTFAPVLDLSAGAGGLIAAQMALMVEEEDRGRGVFTDRLRISHIEDMLLTTLLLYQGHSHAAHLERPARRLARRDVRRAIGYIDANLEQPIRLEDLVAVSGAPGRSLNAHFREATGLSPMAYLRRERLRAARRALEIGQETSVTAVALRFGFGHVGRFASDYRAAYGEAPSETLLRSGRG